MITTSIRPTSRHVHIELDVPQEYVGKNVEVVLQLKQEEPSVTMGQFAGILTPEEAEALQAYVRKSREEWDRDFY